MKTTIVDCKTVWRGNVRRSALLNVKTGCRYARYGSSRFYTMSCERNVGGYALQKPKSIFGRYAFVPPLIPRRQIGSLRTPVVRERNTITTSNPSNSRWLLSVGGGGGGNWRIPPGGLRPYAQGFKLKNNSERKKRTGGRRKRQDEMRRK